MNRDQQVHEAFWLACLTVYVFKYSGDYYFTSYVSPHHNSLERA
eukprot:COSAG01_NODE_1163_length_11454_cov_3.546808_4_plen_44_part_00